MTSAVAADITFNRDQSFDQRLIADLRTDHAGETGAVCIYKGVLAVSRDPETRAFARNHLETERKHLAAIEDILSLSDRSRLLPIWRLAGWLTGALPALFGPNAVFHTIEAVETFVDKHYQEQIDAIALSPRHAALRALLLECQADEIDHRDEARSFARRAAGPAMRCWTRLVAAGSQRAVEAARRI